MADRLYVQGLSVLECSDPNRLMLKITEMANYLNELLTVLKDIPTYADNAAAVTGGLATGDWYYDSTLTGIRKVT